MDSKYDGKTTNGKEIYDTQGTGPAYSGTYMSFSGNNCAALSHNFFQLPDTIEVWFRTSSASLQPLIDNYRNTKVEPNPFRLQITAKGKVRYYEMNGDSSFSLESDRLYCDGEWYRAAVTRQYDGNTKTLKVVLYLFDKKGGIIEKCREEQPLCERKVRDFCEYLHFTNLTPPYLGTDWFHEGYMSGDIGEIFLWNRALTEEELLSRHNLSDHPEGLMYHLAYQSTPEGMFAYDKIGGSLTAKLMDSWIDEVTFFKGDYSILVIGDPQRLVKYYPHQVFDMFRWIANKAERLGIRLVLSVGDLVHDKTEEQYSVIENAAKLIYSKLPFLIIDGNHDYSGGNRELALYKKTFDTATWRNQAGFAGAFEDGSMSNSYYTYEFCGDKYIFLMLELAARDEVLDWANKILRQYKDYKAIITTHAHLDVSGTYLNIDDYNTFYASRSVKDSNTDAKKLWNALICRHENIKMVFSGHMGCCDIVWRADRGIYGNTVYTFCIDGEKMDSDFGGVGSVALFSFTAGGNNVGINYYSVSRNQLIGEKNQFSITLDSPIKFVSCQNGSNKDVEGC
jgi:hypothetical protein